jgi:hypothetical protein
MTTLSCKVPRPCLLQHHNTTSDTLVVERHRHEQTIATCISSHALIKASQARAHSSIIRLRFEASSILASITSWAGSWPGYLTLSHGFPQSVCTIRKI